MVKYTLYILVLVNRISMMMLLVCCCL